MTTYRLNVTSYVVGNGSYNASVSGMVINCGVTLLVVYSDPSLPTSRVKVNDTTAALNTTINHIKMTVVNTFDDVSEGVSDVWIHTVADETSGPYPGGSGETIGFNNTVVGGPIDANLGPYASLIHLTGLDATAGTDTVLITTPQDWFDWDLTVLTSPNTPPVAVDDYFGSVGGSNVVGNVLANDYDDDGDALTAQKLTVCSINLMQRSDGRAWDSGKGPWVSRRRGDAASVGSC
jgi:hypothetical protein